MSVSVIEKRRVFTHAEDASIVLWLLKRKRWKYKLDTAVTVEVVDSEDSVGLEPKNLLICISISFYLCGAALRTHRAGQPASEPEAAGVQVSDSELESLAVTSTVKVVFATAQC